MAAGKAVWGFCLGTGAVRLMEFGGEVAFELAAIVGERRFDAPSSSVQRFS